MKLLARLRHLGLPGAGGPCPGRPVLAASWRPTCPTPGPLKQVSLGHDVTWERGSGREKGVGEGGLGAPPRLFPMEPSFWSWRSRVSGPGGPGWTKTLPRGPGHLFVPAQGGGGRPGWVPTLGSTRSSAVGDLPPPSPSPRGAGPPPRALT